MMLNNNRDNINITQLTRARNRSIFLSSDNAVGSGCGRTLSTTNVTCRRRRRAVRHLLATSIIIGDPNVPSDTPILRSLVRRNVPVISRVRFYCPCLHNHAVNVANDGNGAAAAVLVCRILHATNLSITLKKGVNESLTRRIISNARR